MPRLSKKEKNLMLSELDRYLYPEEQELMDDYKKELTKAKKWSEILAVWEKHQKILLLYLANRDNTRVDVFLTDLIEKCNIKIAELKSFGGDQ